MKKQIILLAIWVLASAIAFASGSGKGENLTVKIEKGDVPKTIIVRLSNLDKVATEIGVQSTEGRVWYSDYVYWKTDFAAKLNLSEVGEGDYVLYVRNYAEMWVQTFNLNDAGISLFETPASAKMHKPGVAVQVSYRSYTEGVPVAKFTKDGPQKIGLKLLNLQNQTASINIVEVGSDRVFSQTVKGEWGIVTVLNMTGLMPDGYFICIHTPDATFVQFFDLKEAGLMLGDFHSAVHVTPALKEAVTSN